MLTSSSAWLCPPRWASQPKTAPSDDKSFIKAGDMILPNFLVIGAQKSGTKWLYRNLSRHSDVFLPDGGGLEVHYLDEFSYGDVKWWGDHYWNVGPQSQIGDITPDYAVLSHRRINHCFSLCPKMRVIYTLRNPKQRAVSHLRMLHGKTELNYRGENQGPLLKTTSDLERLVTFFETGPGFDHGDYLNNIRRWESFYPSEQILILSYDLLQTDPKKYLKRVCDFLEIPLLKDTSLQDKRFHVSDPHPITPEFLPHLDRIFDPGLQKLEKYVGFKVSHWLSPCEA